MAFIMWLSINFYFTFFYINCFLFLIFFFHLTTFIVQS